MGDDVLKEIPKYKLEEVYDTLEKDIPISLHVFNFIKSFDRGDPDEEIDFKVFGLNGEACNGMILASAFYLNRCGYKFIMLHYNRNCLDKLDVCNIFMKTNQLKWDGLIFEAVYEKFLPSLMFTLQEKNIFSEGHSYRNVALPKEAYCRIKDCKPAGTSYRLLTLSDAASIDKTWAYHSPDTYEYVRHCIRRGGGVGIISHDGKQLISWAVAVFGSIGMVYTVPQYRQQGHAAFAIQLLSQKFIEEGTQPYATIRSNNEISLQIFHRVGFVDAGEYHCIETK